MSSRDELANKIKRALGGRGLSCTTVSRFLNIGLSTVCHWCTGHSIPNLFHQEKLLSLLAKIDKNFPNLSLPLLQSGDFTPFNKALLTHKQAVLRQNRKNYIYSQKDKENT